MMLQSFLLLALNTCLAICTCSNIIPVESDYYYCEYRVQDSSTACNSPIFISCMVHQIIKNQTKFCDNQFICAQYCCKQSTLFCPKLASQQASGISIPMIACILSGFILIGVMIVCLFKFNQECSFCFERFCCCFKKHSIKNQFSQTINETQIKIDPDTQTWKRSYRKMQEIDCAVCLSESSNLMLDCGHIFHSKCILECFKRRFECVLCRKTHLHSFRLYCLRCKVAYRQFHALQLAHFANLAVKECESCVLSSLQA